MSIKTAEDLFVHKLSDLYRVEKQAIKVLPKSARAADNPQLAKAFDTHLEDTHGQVERIDKSVELMGIRLKRIKCVAMKGLVEDANEEIGEGPVLDAVLIGGAQKVEHYEKARYGTLAALAKQRGLQDVMKLLLETLEDEKATDKKRTMSAVQGVARVAMAK